MHDAKICSAALTAFAVLVSASSLAFEIPALPEASFADTEVSTNIALAVGERPNAKLVFSLELDASPSNSVEVAIGCDADGDGRLSIAESALAVGYDCGEWFVRSAADDEVSAGDAQDTGHVRMSYEVQPRRVDARWNMVRVTRRGLCASGESAAFEQIESGFRLILR